jgi:hypothetical protein
MIFEVPVIPVILSLFWLAVAIGGFVCCLYACWMFLDSLFTLFKG